MDPQNAQSLSSWIQAGGVLAFAAAVWFQLRQQTPVLQEMRDSQKAILEWVRMSIAREQAREGKV